ncbi:MAG: hypothetical protein II943_00735 [Victivallales bacterium]|nr:hypothetical protein [Victivallales bacterium]
MAGTPEMLAHLAERARSHARWDKARRLVARDTRDLGRLMASIDFETTMARLGLEVRPAGGDEWMGYCPDHIAHTGHPQDEPKWYINARTGQTYCFTEHRGSNLVAVARYIWRLDSYEAAYDALLDGQALAIPEMPWKAIERQKAAEADEIAKLTKSLENAAPLLEEGRITPRCRDYFARYGISVDTLRKYGVASADKGYFGGRWCCRSWIPANPLWAMWQSICLARRSGWSAASPATGSWRRYPTRRPSARSSPRPTRRPSTPPAFWAASTSTASTRICGSWIPSRRS